MENIITLDERSRLYQCEEIIEHGLNTFVDVGNALLEIRDSKLYRQDFTTFEDYCKERWGIERRRAYQLMDAAKAVENVYLSTQTVPVNELQARPLTALDPQEQIEAWKRVIENTPEGKITAAVVLKAAKEVEREKRQERRQDRIESTPVIPNGKYNVIYADPPWKYEFGFDIYGAADRHYHTMTIQELCDLPIRELAEDNAVLFLWVTSPKLFDAHEIITAWGFDYKTSFIWDKVKHVMGHYNSVRHEVLLVCVRGSFPKQSDTLHDSVISIERSNEHSEKPDYFRELIETMYPKSKKIELFARRSFNGWDSWGNEL
jgi:N6-adenosine-specific RNA methylase IME4